MASCLSKFNNLLCKKKKNGCSKVLVSSGRRLVSEAWTDADAVIPLRLVTYRRSVLTATSAWQHVFRTVPR